MCIFFLLLQSHSGAIPEATLLVGLIGLKLTLSLVEGFELPRHQDVQALLLGLVEKARVCMLHCGVLYGHYGGVTPKSLAVVSAL